MISTNRSLLKVYTVDSIVLCLSQNEVNSLDLSNTTS